MANVQGLGIGLGLLEFQSYVELLCSYLRYPPLAQGVQPKLTQQCAWLNNSPWFLSFYKLSYQQS